MKKTRIVISIVFCMVFIFATKVLADDNFNMKIEADKTFLKRGDIVYITVKLDEVTFENGINLINIRNFNYNKNIFEIQTNYTFEDDGEEAFVDGANFAIDNKISIDGGVLAVPVNKELIKIPLLVKDDAELGETNISLNNIEGQTATKPVKYSTGSCEPIVLTIIEDEYEEKVNLTGLKILNQPNKLEYIEGEKINLEGIKVQAIYSDGSTSDITNFTYKPEEELTEKDKEIIIKYSEDKISKEIAIPITVSSKKIIVEKAKLESIMVSMKPNKTEYIEGEKFDLSGMEITAVYTDGTKNKISNYLVEPQGELTTEINKITIKYKENNLERTCTIPITVKAKEVEKDKTEDKNTTKKEDEKKKENIDTKIGGDEKKKENIVTKKEDNAKENQDIIKNQTNDETKANDSKLPQTGIKNIYLPIIFGIILIAGACIFYIKYKKIKYLL